jgi:tRNA-binding protein
MEQVIGKWFEKIELRVETIIEVGEIAEARKPTNWLKIDFGDPGIERSSTQIKNPDSLDCPLGKPFPRVLNFPPKQAASCSPKF